jgi:hypothetical protein
MKWTLFPNLKLCMARHNMKEVEKPYNKNEIGK